MAVPMPPSATLGRLQRRRFSLKNYKKLIGSTFFCLKLVKKTVEWAKKNLCLLLKGPPNILFHLQKVIGIKKKTRSRSDSNLFFFRDPNRQKNFWSILGYFEPKGVIMSSHLGEWIFKTPSLFYPEGQRNNGCVYVLLASSCKLNCTRFWNVRKNVQLKKLSWKMHLLSQLFFRHIELWA